MKGTRKAFKATMLAVFLAALSAGLLTACGGGGGSDGSAMAAPEPPAAPATAGDAFTAAMVALVRSAPDDAEPADVERAMITSLDGGEPVAVE